MGGVSAMGRRTDASPRLPAANTPVPSATSSYATEKTGSKSSWVRSACATKGWALGKPKAIEDLGDRRLLDDGGNEPEPHATA